MQTIGEILGYQVGDHPVEVPELPSGSIGIELELEGGRFPFVEGWRNEADGSLRNGVEYVFDGPKAGRAALHAITAMSESLKKNPPAPTFRCSTHIHLDIRDLEFQQLQKLVATYTMFEDVMFDHCDEYRRYSNFCIPYFVNDNLLQRARRTLNEARRSESGRLQNLGNFPKYSAFNLQPVTRFGSVEFRGSHAMTTGAELLGLAQRMLHLKRVVLESDGRESLAAYVERLNHMQPRDVFVQGLKDGYARDAKLADICYSNALFSYTEDVVLAATDWNAEHPLAGLRDRPRREQAPQHMDDQRVVFNAETFEIYGIQVPAVQSVRTALRLVNAFRGIQGVIPPTFNQLVVNAETLLSPQLAESFRRNNIPWERQYHGFN